MASVIAALAWALSSSYRRRRCSDSDFFPSPAWCTNVIWQLRAPRALAAFACGGLLALAGALLQVLLRNALADPYVLGVSAAPRLARSSHCCCGAGAAR